MQFNGFEVTPCGNATLTINNNILTVSGISDSGLDGVLIKVENTDNYVVNFGSLDTISQNNGVLKSTALVKNSFGMVTPLYESFKWYDQGTDKVIIGYNQAMLPSNYNFYGKLNGQLVFDIPNGTIPTSPDSDFPPPTPLSNAFWGVVVGIAGIAVAVWAVLHTKEITSRTWHYDAEGHITGYDLTITEDPTPFDIEVNGTTYTVTEYGFKYDENLPPELNGYPSIKSNAIGHQITGSNLGSFDIESIQAL